MEVIKPLTEVQALYNCKIKKYDNFEKVVTFSKPIFNPYKFELRKELTNSKIIKKYDNSNKKNRGIRYDNIKRSRDKAYDICYANNFKYFVTFTLDKNKIDRYDPKEISKKLKKWLDNNVQRKNIKYIIFPEYHFDKAIHFHGLMSGDLELIDSGKVTKNKQKIYNAGTWTLGYSTVIILDSQKDRIINYVIKYITKDNDKIMGNYYFAGGKGLNREVPTTYKNVNFYKAEGKIYDIPNTKMRVKYHINDI